MVRSVDCLVLDILLCVAAQNRLEVRLCGWGGKQTISSTFPYPNRESLVALKSLRSTLTFATWRLLMRGSFSRWEGLCWGNWFRHSIPSCFHHPRPLILIYRSITRTTSSSNSLKASMVCSRSQICFTLLMWPSQELLKREQWGKSSRQLGVSTTTVWWRTFAFDLLHETLPMVSGGQARSNHLPSSCCSVSIPRSQNDRSWNSTGCAWRSSRRRCPRLVFAERMY